MGSAERVRRHRKRQRRGLVRLAIDAPEVGLSELLIAVGYLPEGWADDRTALGRALEAYLADMSADAAFERVTSLHREVLRRAMLGS